MGEEKEGVVNKTMMMMEPTNGLGPAFPWSQRTAFVVLELLELKAWENCQVDDRTNESSCFRESPPTHLSLVPGRVTTTTDDDGFII